MKFLDSVYHALLWLCGIPKGWHFSDFLAIQKHRLGKVWWAFPILTILVLAALLGFAIWLTRHIATYRLRKI